MIPYVVYSLLAASNPFTGLFFKLSPEMEYSHGILFMPIGAGAIMFYSAIGLVIVLFHRKNRSPCQRPFTDHFFPDYCYFHLDSIG